jgi:hypothetical protein
MLSTLIFVFLICWLSIQLFDLIIWCFQELRYPQNLYSLLLRHRQICFCERKRDRNEHTVKQNR